ncbi:hypothetical protein [Sphingomonas colocasiae]|nr:hypothetical protein [Sphingomonas colocasiae]
MRDWVKEWHPDGRLCIWRYADPGRNWRGWHLAADPVGCRSLRRLLDCMQGGEACSRKFGLAPVTGAILSVPNAGRKIEVHFKRLRISYLPDFEDLHLAAEDERLLMTVGDRRIHKLSSAFALVEKGGGDFDVRTSEDRKADPWMFWWMPDINYHLENRQ